MADRKTVIRHSAFISCNRKSPIEIRQFPWGHSSVGRAPALQAGSQGFESPCLQPRNLSGLPRRSFSGGGPFGSYGCKCGELRLGKPVMTKFFYVYILQSEADPDRFYTGLTNDLRMRLKHHNSRRIVHTAKWKPWRLKTYVALSDRRRAAQLERYLKSASGRAFIRSHL